MSRIRDLTAAEQHAVHFIKTRPVCELCGRATPHGTEFHHVPARGRGQRQFWHLHGALGVCQFCHRGIHTEGVLFILQSLIARQRHTTLDDVRRTVRELIKT